MDEQLKELIQNFDFKEYFKKKNYCYFDKGKYNLNIIGIRNKNHKVTNKFDDALVLIYKINIDSKERKVIFPITTDAGLTYMETPITTKGTAILVPNQYRGCFQIGKHQNKYTALVQRKPVSVYRDRNKDLTYDMNDNTIETGMFGINIHRSNPYYASQKIDKYSAGCQVFQNPYDFNSFMKLCEKQRALYGNSFTYTLLTQEELEHETEYTNNN